MRRSSRAVLVTGCSSGIGHATAAASSRAGWPVYATARRLDRARAASIAPDGADPYREFTAGLLASTRNVYERGPLARLAGTSEDVAKTVVGAVTASRPRARYPVTASARLLRTARRLLPDRAWDAFLATQFVRPGPHRG